MSVSDTTSTSRDGACKPLFDACTPLLYRHNAFRITGLPVDASTRDIKRRLDDLKHAEELDDAAAEHAHAFALSPPPGIDRIRHAAQRLNEPEHRLIDEFFWFWPTEWGSGRNDPALCALISRDKDAAFKIWSGFLAQRNVAQAAVAKHNLAVMYQLVALDAEHIALQRDISKESLERIAKYWRASFKWWEELTDDEIFWSLVTDRIRAVDDPRLTTGFARRIRANLPNALDQINAMLAMEFVECRKLSLAANHIAYMKETHPGRDDIRKTLGSITRPIRTRVQNAIERAEGAAVRNPEHAASAAHELLAAVAEPLQIIDALLSTSDHDRIDLCDAIAEACLTCEAAHSRHDDDCGHSLAILDAALKYAVSSDARKRIAERRTEVTNTRLISRYLEPLMQKLKLIESMRTVSEQVHAVQNDVVKDLQAIRQLPELAGELYDTCADLIARFLRSLSVASYNDHDDLPSALRILELAMRIVRGQQGREQLQQDQAHLESIRAEATRRNLRLDIRSDQVEVTNDFVRYNSQKIPVSGVQGLKFGVFCQYTNGIKSSSSYLIDISGGRAGTMSIECKRMFRGEAQAEKDYSRIIEAVLHQVAPSLVQRLAMHVVSGNPLAIGDCRLRTDGLSITTGSLWWRKETLVPLSDLWFLNHQGHLHVGSQKDKRVRASMSLRDTWNAVLVEFIVKAVIKLKAQRG